ncbi:hypothetical protein Tco_0676394, partial [Tanacetum coccineum]
MANNQNRALPFHLDSRMAMKQRKRENNLMNWKRDAIIVIKDSDDKVYFFEWEGVSLWDENNNNNNNEIGADGAIVAEEIVDVGA